MASPTRPAAPPVESSPTAVPATVQQQHIFSELGVLEDAFFAADANSATGEESAPGAECSSVEIGASVANKASVAPNTTVERSQAEQSGDRNGAALIDNATVDKNATGELLATDAPLSVPTRNRIRRPRPLIRITDGLTPGQYAVYNLMYEAGEDAGRSSRIYRGGYADLGRLTGLSKRGIQKIVAELHAKQIIRMHQKPGYHRTETSAYLVPDAATVLATWSSNGWRHALGKSKTLIG